MPSWLPKLYPILDSSAIPSIYPAPATPEHQSASRTEWLEQLGQSLTKAGLTLLEYRNKFATDAQVLADVRALRMALPAGRVKLIVDDRVDIALAAQCDGAHVDAGDIPPADARRLLGPDCIVGTSAGTPADLSHALNQPVDYIAFGPVFPTSTKQTSAAPIGVEGVRSFRNLAGPGATLVAAAGITLKTAPAILAAGADAVAVSAAIFKHENPAEELERWLKALA